MELHLVNLQAYFGGLEQHCINSIANALELLQSWSKPPIYFPEYHPYTLTRHPVTWATANQTCETRGEQLVVMDTEEEKMKVVQFLLFEELKEGWVMHLFNKYRVHWNENVFIIPKVFSLALLEVVILMTVVTFSSKWRHFRF